MNKNQKLFRTLTKKGTDRMHSFVLSLNLALVISHFRLEIKLGIQFEFKSNFDFISNFALKKSFFLKQDVLLVTYFPLERRDPSLESQQGIPRISPWVVFLYLLFMQFTVHVIGKHIFK